MIDWCLRLIANYVWFERLLLCVLRCYYQLMFVVSSEIVLIHSIGKVGSSTLQESLKKHRRLVIHTHFFNKENISYWKRYYIKSPRRAAPMHIYRGQAIAGILDKTKKDIRIITPFREPVSREFSSLFQDNRVYPELLGDVDQAMGVLRKIGGRLAKELPEERWINRELKQTLGFDIYKENFPCSKGFITLEKDNKKILVFRLENLESLFPSVFDDFLHSYAGRLINVNVGAQKAYSKRYKAIREKKMLSENDILAIQNQQFWRWMYPDFDTKLKARWGKE